jgi:hypothetical protein
MRIFALEAFDETGQLRSDGAGLATVLARLGSQGLETAVAIAQRPIEQCIDGNRRSFRMRDVVGAGIRPNQGVLTLPGRLPMQMLHSFAGPIQRYFDEIADPDRHRPDHCPQCEARHDNQEQWRALFSRPTTDRASLATSLTLIGPLTPAPPEDSASSPEVTRCSSVPCRPQSPWCSG